MNVVVTDAAFADLLQIGRTIRADNPMRAETFVAELYERCNTLGQMPLAYPLIPNWENRGIRRRVHRKYVIFYRVRLNTVEVIHVLHGAMDYETVLFGEN